MRRKQGFTLLELVIVIIIIGILATLGIVQYTTILENGRKAEAKTVLGAMRKQAIIWFQEGGKATTYPASADLGPGAGTLLGIPTVAPACTNTSYYFGYTMNSTTGTGTAARCTGGGKAPQGAATTLTLAVDGTTAGW